MTQPHLVVWYNTRCPVCDAGIKRQRNKLIAAVQAGTIVFRDINLEPQALAAMALRSRMCVAASMPPTKPAACWRAPTSRSRFGGARRVNAGWPCSSAIPSFVRWRVSPTIASPTSFTLGICARGVGRDGTPVSCGCNL